VRSEAVGDTARQAEALSCDRTSIRGMHGPHARGWCSQLRLLCSSFAFNWRAWSGLSRFADPGAEYDVFQRGHIRAAALDENKALLRIKYGEAKALGREART